MNILILGAGTVGTSIARLLCSLRHRVTVVEENADLVRRIDSELDVRAIHGSGSDSNILFQAGALGADLCLAATGVDEVNLVGASTAKAMGTRRAVARVFAPGLLDTSTFDYATHFNIDRLLSLEHLTARELARNIRFSGSIPIESFARGKIEVQSLLIEEDTPALGVALRDMRLPKAVRIGTIHREDRLKIAQADDVLQRGDRITLVGTREDIDDVREMFQRGPLPRLGLVIAGGGETGYHLARMLEGRRFSIVLMESNRSRCEFLSQHLAHTTIVHCDATRRDHLEEERVGSADVFVACLGNDEDNIMSGVEARELGVRMIMAVVHRPDYANLVGKLGIDFAVSPRQVMARQVLGFLTEGPVISHTSLEEGAVEVLEIEVGANVPATEHVLAKLKLPPHCLIAAVMQAEYVSVPGADDRLKPGDTVVLLAEQSAVEEALRLFRGNGTR